MSQLSQPDETVHVCADFHVPETKYFRMHVLCNDVDNVVRFRVQDPHCITTAFSVLLFVECNQSKEIGMQNTNKKSKTDRPATDRLQTDQNEIRGRSSNAIIGFIFPYGFVLHCSYIP